jgi:hypothetical protein
MTKIIKRLMEWYPKFYKAIKNCFLKYLIFLFNVNRLQEDQQNLIGIACLLMVFVV